MLKSLIIPVALVLLAAASCSKGSSSPAPQPTPPPDPTQDTSFITHVAFPVGAAINVSLLRNSLSYRNLVTKEFKSITAETAMKFSQMHPGPNTYFWTDADYLVSYAQQYNKRIHGHTLIWHNSMPAWVTDFVGDSAAWENLFKTHIQTVVTHFKGKVASWDVVNEVLNDDGSLRNSIWLQKLGSGYIARAFQYAHAADPDALLFYNEYGHEYSSTKRTAIINLVTNLKNAGVPIHGIGMQMHTRYTQTDANLAAAISTAAQTGLKVHISELDISVNPDNNQNLTFNSLLEQQQALKYKYIVSAYKAIPEAQKFGITQWNVTDGDSWLTSSKPDWPLPFNSNYKRKAAYKAIIEAAK